MIARPFQLLMSWLRTMGQFIPKQGARQIALLAVLVWAGLVLGGAAVKADETAVENGRSALDTYRGFPWYDSTQDAAKPIRLPEPRASSSWNWNWNWDWLSASWEFFTEYFYVVLAIVILLFVLFVLYRFYQVHYTSEEEKQRNKRRKQKVRRHRDRVEALPFELEISTGDLLSEAQRRVSQGDYRQGIIYLYSHRLVQLDQNHRILLTKGKTNRQYLREVGMFTPLGEILEHTIYLFEDAFFGRREISHIDFQACIQRQPEFETLMVQPSKPNAEVAHA